MFGFIRKRRPIVHAHWYVPLLDFSSDTGQFYQSVENDIRARMLPDVEIERVPFREGGVLSANREYIRLTRERVSYDLCSAPFGTGWWFSGRAVVLPRVLHVWEIVLTGLCFLSFCLIYWQIFGVMTGSFVLGVSLITLLAFFLSARRWSNLDEFFLHLPVLGALYERFLRPETYHRQDLRLMFADTTNTIVRAKVVEFCVAGGVDDPSFVQVSRPGQILTATEAKRYAHELPSG